MINLGIVLLKTLITKTPYAMTIKKQYRVLLFDFL